MIYVLSATIVAAWVLMIMACLPIGLRVPILRDILKPVVSEVTNARVRYPNNES